MIFIEARDRIALNVGPGFQVVNRLSFGAGYFGGRVARQCGNQDALGQFRLKFSKRLENATEFPGQRRRINRELQRLEGVRPFEDWLWRNLSARGFFGFRFHALTPATPAMLTVTCSAICPPHSMRRPPIRMSPTTNPAAGGTWYSSRKICPGAPRTIVQ